MLEFCYDSQVMHWMQRRVKLVLRSVNGPCFWPKMHYGKCRILCFWSWMLLRFSAAALYSPMFSFNSRPTSWIPSLLWLVSSHMPEPAPLATTEQLFWITLTITCKTSCQSICKCVTWCIAEPKEFKAALLMGRFRHSVFCGIEELLLVPTLTFLTFKTLFKCTRTQWRKGEKWQSIIRPIKTLQNVSLNSPNKSGNIQTQ